MFSCDDSKESHESTKNKIKKSQMDFTSFKRSSVWERPNRETLNGYFWSGADTNLLKTVLWRFVSEGTDWKQDLNTDWTDWETVLRKCKRFSPVDIKPSNFSNRWLLSASHSDRQRTLCILHGRDVLGGIKTALKKTCLYNIICKCPCTLEVDGEHCSRKVWDAEEKVLLLQFRALLRMQQH